MEKKYIKTPKRGKTPKQCKTWQERKYVQIINTIFTYQNLRLDSRLANQGLPKRCAYNH